jgi:hypothetical protein
MIGMFEHVGARNFAASSSVAAARRTGSRCAPWRHAIGTTCERDERYIFPNSLVRRRAS